jgi:cystathionine beta-lyase/cystathionine gamma-synthase
LAALENAKYCIATSSGMAAFSLIIHLVKSGEHVIANEDLYGGTTNYLIELVKEAGVMVTPMDLRDLKAIEGAIKPNTRMIIAESPTNPTLKILDLPALSKLCKAKNLTMVVDNTFMSPALQNPLDLGVDIVMHSCTKYIGGHSDIIMGAVLTSNDELYKRLKKTSHLLGACPGPQDCFLASRGLKTLQLRVEKAEENAGKLAQILCKHPKVVETLYPGLPTHPGHDLLKSQARGFSSMITIKLKNAEQVAKFYTSLSLFGHAVSLGGVESLVSIPAKITHKSLPAELKTKLGITDTMIRISVGIESYEDLKDDLLHALDQI